MTTSELASRAQAGERLALESLVVSEGPRVARLLIRILGPRDDLEDLVQNVFLELCRSLPKFRGDSTISTFIGGITVRVARRAMRPGAWWTRRAAMPQEVAAPERSPERELDAKDQLARVRVALAHISEKKRIAFLLWTLDDMSVEEIAATTQASVAATKARIYHARRELKRRAAADPGLRKFVEGGTDAPT